MKTKKSTINFLNALQELDTKNIEACVDFADYFVHKIVNIEFPHIELKEKELRECGVLKENEKYNQYALNQPGSTVYFVKYQKFLGYADIGLVNLKKLAELRFILFTLDEVIPNNQDKKRQFASVELASYMRAVDTLKHAAVELYNKSRLLKEYVPDENQDEAEADFIEALDLDLEKKLTLTNPDEIKARCQNVKVNIENQLALRNQNELFIHTMSKLWSLYEFLLPPKIDSAPKNNLIDSSYDDYTLSIFEEELRFFQEKFAKITDVYERTLFLDFSTTLNDYIKIKSKKIENDRIIIAKEFATVLALLEHFNTSMTSEDKESCIDILNLKKQELIFENSLYEIETIIAEKDITAKDEIFSNITQKLKAAFHGNGESCRGVIHHAHLIHDGGERSKSHNVADSISSSIEARKTIISLLTHLYRLIGNDYAQAINDLNSRHFQLEFKKIQGNELIWHEFEKLIKLRQADDFDNKLNIILCPSATLLAVDLSISKEIQDLGAMLKNLFSNEIDNKKRMQLIKLITEIANFFDSKNSHLERDRVLSALATSEVYSLKTNFPQIVVAIENLVSAYGKNICRFIEDTKNGQLAQAVNTFYKSYKAYAQKEFSLIKLQSKQYETFKKEPAELKNQNKKLLSQLHDKESYAIFFQQKANYFEDAFKELNLALDKIRAKKSDFAENQAVLERLKNIIDAISSYCMLETSIQYENNDVALIYQAVLKQFASLLSAENKEKLQLFITEVTQMYNLRYSSDYVANHKKQYTLFQYPLDFSPEAAEKIVFDFNTGIDKLPLFTLAMGKIKKSEAIIEDESDVLNFHDYLSMGYFSHLNIEISQNFIKKEFKSREVITKDYFDGVQGAIREWNAAKMPRASDAQYLFLYKMLQAMELHNQRITQAKGNIATNSRSQPTVQVSNKVVSKEPTKKWFRRFAEGVILLGVILVGIIALGTPVGWAAITGVGLWLGYKVVKKSLNLIVSCCKKNSAVKQPQPNRVVRSVSEIGRGPINSSATELDRKNKTRKTLTHNPSVSPAWITNKGTTKTNLSRRRGCFYQQPKKVDGNKPRAVSKSAISCVSGG